MGVCCSPTRTPSCLLRSSLSELSAGNRVCRPARSSPSLFSRARRFSASFYFLPHASGVLLFVLSLNSLLLPTTGVSVRGLRTSPDVSYASPFRLKGVPISSLSPLASLSFAFPSPGYSVSPAPPFSPALGSRNRSATESGAFVSGHPPPLASGTPSLFPTFSGNNPQPSEMFLRSLSRLASLSSSPGQAVSKGPVALAIEKKLTEGLQPTQLQVVDETPLHAGHEGTQGLRSAETHFRIFVKSAEFKGLPLVQRHRKVYALLQKELDEGIHAMAIHAEAAE
ncbi:hypothetical protein NCLIV_015980 [Neospora caninum Liverpool]|uniref:BolA family protein n=1 Tax=Neospora caninum (strain Liverpool) TaxID=572307 RepID=F0VDL3_NEOCL|nr:hypothetical protein NCLIV_015980 [Neospora caninum Liverpool]CBZ51806.1 hypothetical protein NCLIV_015980 [Neospora caninum Liverpool]CEL65764.1 TPA: BolA family protein [Neospora caninum Liverpool]|eukprot:XP_003881839.1 hypothetical protein NCLIV_015980 [Neospora caninum Liverpool]